MPKVNIDIVVNRKDFEHKLKSLNKDIKESTSQLKSFTKNLEVNYNPEKLKLGMKEAQKAISLADEKVVVLKNRLEHLEKVGKMDTDDYRKLQKELNYAEIKAIELGNELKKLNKIEFTNNKFNKLGKNLENAGKKISKVGETLAPLSATTGAIIAGFAKIGSSTIKYADDIATASERLGLSSENLQKWNYIAQQTDVSQQELSTGFRNLNGAIAKLGSGEINNATKALNKLGIDSSQALNGLDGNLDKIIDSLIAVENPTERLALANELFGAKVGQSLVPMLNQGSEGLKTLKTEFESLGYMTNEQVAQMANFDNVLNKLKTALTNVRNQIGIALMPVMISFSEIMQNNVVLALQKITKSFEKITPKMLKVITVILMLVTAIAPVLMIAGKVTQAIGVVVRGIRLLRGALTALAAHPIVLIIIAIVALLTILYMKCEAFREAINKIFKVVCEALAPIFSLFGKIMSVVGNIISEIAQIIGEVLAPVLTMVGQILSPLIKLFLQPLIMHFKMLATILKAVFSIIKPIADVLRKVLAPVLGFIGKIVSKVGKIVQWVIYGVVKGIEYMVNMVIKAINFLLGPINRIITFFGGSKITIDEVDFSSSLDPNKVTDMHDKASEEAKELEKNKKGGTLSNAGKTIANGGSNNTIINNNTTNNYNSDASTINVTVQNYGAEADPQELAKAIKLQLVRGGS